MFADDLIMFCKADPTILQHIMAVLHDFNEYARLKANIQKSQMVLGGCSHELWRKCKQIMGLQDSNFPLKHLGVLITKITAKLKIWASRRLSHAGRAMLINIVVFGMFNYWVSIFILPTEVVNKITQLFRNYLWGGIEEFKRVPLISWQHACLPKAQGGLGLKDFTAWNKATIAKVIWAIARKKDISWVKWLHGRYIRGKSWWNFTSAPDSSWYYKKIYQIKEIFEQGCTNQSTWDWQGTSHYTVKQGYKWLMGGNGKVEWAKLIWARSNTPRYAFICWVFIPQRLPTRGVYYSVKTQTGLKIGLNWIGSDRIE
ncbi:hypothetical protein Cgig2_010282 [Carnegiea gigantea]|uniref:Reverse transcriptase zinc-binding domain-containing protein n=1 Tax=Carnegiea gigantea TaxID=171969 RepID=A0A9Q1Q5L3_9CARY|nr:hypothetical protein Cgig2_010282 [Carnegiea gigantea]